MVRLKILVMQFNRLGVWFRLEGVPFSSILDSVEVLSVSKLARTILSFFPSYFRRTYTAIWLPLIGPRHTFPVGIAFYRWQSSPAVDRTRCACIWAHVPFAVANAFPSFKVIKMSVKRAPSHASFSAAFSSQILTFFPTLFKNILCRCISLPGWQKVCRGYFVIPYLHLNSRVRKKKVIN